jgi:thioredoxin-like negative regulator of GroEL
MLNAGVAARVTAVVRVEFMSEDSQSSLEQLRRKVAGFPTDLQARFELGAALHAQRDYSAAIKELHAAMCNPYCACRAMRLLIEAYEAMGRPGRAALIRERFLRQCGGAAGGNSAPVSA